MALNITKKINLWVIVTLHVPDRVVWTRIVDDIAPLRWV